MDKLLKHFGLGGKKSPAHQSYRSDNGPLNADSIQDLDLKGVRLPSDCNYGTERRMVVDRKEPYDIHRSNSEYSRTLPTSGEFRAVDLTREQNWSVHRGKIARQSGHSASLKEREPSVKNLGAEGEVSEEEPGQAEAEEACQTIKQQPAKPIPLSDDYSDPYDLRKQGAVVTAVVHEPVEVKVVPRTDTSEGDYSVPYDLKNRNKDLVKMKEPEKPPVMYDDPYEESPLAPIALSCASAVKHQQQQQQHPYQQQQLQQQQPLQQQQQLLQQQQLQQQQQQQQLQHQLQQQLQGLGMNESAHRKSACTQTSTLVKDTSHKSLESKDECQKKLGQPTALGESTSKKVLNNGPPVVAPKFYQLSAEYGGIDVPDDEEDDDVGNYTDLQEEGVLAEHLAKPLEEPIYPEGVMLPPVARHARIPLPLAYEEPWDLSVTQRDLEDRLRSKRATGDAMTSSVTLDDARPRDGLMSRSCYAEPLRRDGKGKESKNPESGVPVYGVPWSIRPKDSKQAQGKAVDGPSAGVAKVKVPVPVRSSSLRPVDSRPMEDYDEPWDQKKKIICKTVSDVNGRTGSMTSTNSSHHIANTWSTTLAEQIDTKLPLDKQPWYHANVSRVEAENLLRTHREGSYLVRNSESNKKDFSLSVKSARGFMHMKIVASPDGRFILGQFSQPFSNIAQVIHHYTVHKLPIKGAEHMSLIFPVANKIL